MDKKTQIIDEVNTEWSHNKGSLQVTQYHPNSVNGKTNARAHFTNFSGTATISNPEDKGSNIPLNKYKETFRRHMILHSMWDVFRILDPFDTTKNWDLFHHMDRFTLLTVVSHVEELRKTGDKHTIDNLDWSGEYIRASMELPILNKVLTHVNVAASGPEIQAALILVMYDSNFEVMNNVNNKLTNTKLSNFIGDNVEFYWDNQLSLLQLLDNAGFFQPQNLSCLTCPLTWCTSPEFQLQALNQNKAVSEFSFKTHRLDLYLIPEVDLLEFDDMIRSA